MFNGKHKLHSLLLICLSLGITSCDNDTTVPDTSIDTPIKQLRLKQASSCDDFKNSVSNSWIENLIKYPYYYGGIFIADDTALPTTTTSSETLIASPSPTDVSQTNTHEAGVDEQDMVKASSDGLLYIVVHDMLVIQQAFPPENMTELSHLPLDAYASGLYLDEASGTAIVVARNTNNGYIRASTELIFINIADTSNPKITERISIDGYHTGTRLIGKRLHLVSNLYMRKPEILKNDTELNSLLGQYSSIKYSPTDSEQEELDAVADEIRTKANQLIATLDITDYLPTVNYPLDADNSRTQTIACESIYHPSVTLSETHLLTVTSVDINAENLEQTAAYGSGWKMYASSNDIFISQASSGWWWNDNQRSQTVIHRFGISESTPQYKSSGMVYGTPNNTFNFSFYNDHLRIATTERSGFPSTSTTNHMYVLSDDMEGNLNIIGAINDFASDESIYSVRFLEDRGYVVTFRFIDPLFSFDLSNPEKPVITGELEIPGFSTYIHPIDDNHLLTIGRAGNLRDIQLQIFDVSDMTQPKLLHKFSPDFGNDYSWSPASWDHHAFTYYAPSKLLAIPVSTYNRTTRKYFEGITAFNIELNSGISELGRISHRDTAEQVYCPTSLTEPAPICNNYSGWTLSWLARARRSIVMTSETDTYLYSISNLGVKASNINAISTPINTVTYPLPSEFPIVWYAN